MTSIQPTTLGFLTALSINNNRDWFAENKSTYEIAKANIKAFSNDLLEEMNKIDHIDTLKMHRIYRDVRFSKDKTPYKTDIGGSFHRRKPKLRGGYYLHIQPNNESFIATGFWEPAPADLLRIRKEFEMDEINEAFFKDFKKEMKEWNYFTGY